VTEIAKETGLDDAEVGDINELLENNGEELPTEDLEERAEQLSKDDTEESEADSAMSVRTLTVKSMQEAIALIDKGCEIFCSNDPNCEQSSTVKGKLTQFYSHTITYHQKRKNPDIYSIVFKAVNFLSFS
jgi:hypothetical protein